MSYKELHKVKFFRLDSAQKNIFSRKKSSYFIFSLWRNDFGRVALTLFGMTQAAGKN